MTGRKIVILFSVALAIMSATSIEAATPEESFRKSYPNVRVDSIKPAVVNGLYEILSGSRIFYYVPGPEYIISGIITTKEGRNLTQERVTEILAKNLKELPLEKALKIGTGSHTVIEITDPDCPYCRQASAYLSGRKDLTRYVFFFPLSIHPNAPAKVRYVFCAADPVKAYEEAMTGKLDDMKFQPCKENAGADLMKLHMEIGEKAGVTGTPLFLIDGQVVGGADIPLMEKILGSKKQ
jgi:thiol:disulfide interchange protein DsbC